jgi:hypothetical protein
LKTNEMMTIPRPLSKFAGLSGCVTLALALSACSEDKQDSSATGGSAGTSGSAATAGSAATQAGTTGAASEDIIGTFQVQMQVDETDSSTGLTKVVGQVGDGPIPANVVWTTTKEEGGCRLETPTAPFCEQGCGADVCVADGKCQAYPTTHSVGDVTLTGVKAMGGGSSLMLKEIAKVYQPPAGTTFTYPSFALGDSITLHAAGGDYTPFALAAKGVDPLQITSTDFEIDKDKPLALTWTAPADPKSGQIYVKLDISHHGGIRGMIECDTEDTGSLTISAAMMTDLIGLGVAGFPSVVMVRSSLDTAQIAPGKVRLEVSSRAERYVTVKGVESCTTDDDCSGGKTCRTTDSTCQ